MKNSKKLLSLLLALVMLVALVIPAAAADGAALTSSAQDLSGKLVILHTNDVHGAVENYAKVAELKKQFEAAGAEVLLVDAGDFAQGTTYVSVSEGATAIDLMNKVGYDVATLGNHEFDYGYENLKTILEKAEFTVVNANIVDEKGEPLFQTGLVLDTKVGKVGIFGLETPETATKAHPAKIKGLKFLGGEELYECASLNVENLKAEGAEFIVCLSHLGIDDESKANGNRSVDMLAKVTGIDLLIDGHSHSTLEEVKAAEGVKDGKVGETVLTSTGTKIANVGVVIIDADKNITVESVSADDINVPDGNEVQAAAQAVVDEIEAIYGTAFAKATVNLNGERDPGVRTQETNLGDLIADAILWYATKDDLGVPAENVVAVTNGGGIRASVAAGDISRNDVKTVLPFGNTVAVDYVPGSVLLEALEASTYSTPNAIGAFPQVAGINFTVDTTKAYDAGENYPGTTYAKPNSINRVTINSINGKAFDPKATYAVVTNDFTAAGGDTYYALSVSEKITDTGVLMDDAVVEYITEVLKGEIGEKYAQPQGRIKIVTQADAPLTYTVKYGDTMGQIALNYYGGYIYHYDLYRANADAFAKTGGRLNTGMTLNLPAKLGKAARIEPPVAGEGETLYTVKAGDTLSGIAVKTYGNYAMWKDIYEHNKATISNPNMIYQGQILVLPAKPAAAQQ